MKARTTREFHGQNARELISVIGPLPALIKDRKLTGELVLNFNTGGLTENFSWRQVAREPIEVDWDAIWV